MCDLVTKASGTKLLIHYQGIIIFRHKMDKSGHCHHSAFFRVLIRNTLIHNHAAK